jgi:hypothetical protein
MATSNQHESRQLSRRDVLQYATAACALAIPQLTRASPPHPDGHTDAAAVHNMLLVGTSTPFLCHLPMFEGLTPDREAYTSPHRFQVILSAAFSKAGTDAGRVYTRERERHPEAALYTLSPSAFVLPRLLESDTRALPVRSFGATVFRGHLERGGEAISDLSGIEVRVRDLIHFREFKPANRRSDRLEYILFGAGDELFAAHFITGPPDFDQILSVAVNSPHLRASLQSGSRGIVQNRTNTAAERLRAGDRPVVRMPAERRQFQIEVRREIYFEEGELTIPPDFEPTPEERRSGF